jgi:hypothetical protein
MLSQPDANWRLVHYGRRDLLNAVHSGEAPLSRFEKRMVAHLLNVSRASLAAADQAPAGHVDVRPEGRPAAGVRGRSEQS